MRLPGRSQPAAVTVTTAAGHDQDGLTCHTRGAGSDPLNLVAG
jgi:hypothetical protein